MKVSEHNLWQIQDETDFFHERKMNGYVSEYNLGHAIPEAKMSVFTPS